MRTLLPVFEKFKLTQDLNPGEPETFVWLQEERYDFEKARAGLDSIPGSREYLKNYTFQREEGMPFFNEMGNKIVVSFGDHHSGASSTALAWIYKGLLNDWDAFVHCKKASYARNLYNAQQLSDYDIIDFKNALATGKLANIYKVIDTMTDSSMVTFEREKAYEMLSALVKEREDEAIAKRIQYDKEYYEARIDILKHHYKYPSRWLDSSNGSALFGSIHYITAEMMNDMVKIYPDYREHIASIKARMA